MERLTSVSLVVAVLWLPLSTAWDPDAGLVLSYTKRVGINVTATSGANVNNVVDGNENTNWVSGSCLPSAYLGRPGLNVLLNACGRSECSVNGATTAVATHATDGNPYTTFVVHPDLSVAKFTVTLEHPLLLQVISVGGKYNTDTHLYGVTPDSSRRFLATLTSVNNYKTVNIFINESLIIKELELESSAEIMIKELGAIGPAGCWEEVTVDLGQVQPVATVKTRHWAGRDSASSLVLMLSDDGNTWSDIHLDPNALHSVTTTFPTMNVRYMKLQYELNMKDYTKVYCYEIDAWDADGIWGPNISPKPQIHTFRELLGVNGIWGWGHSKYSNALGAEEGPFLYSRVASHARNYHNLDWDVTDPDFDPGYANMTAGRGTQAKWWLNWDTEYSVWRNASLVVDASIQFTNQSMPDYRWNTPEQSAFNYGKEFARHFGPTQGNGLISALEVGNEPWDYSPEFYSNVLKGMSAGVKSVDTGMIVSPGAFQAENKDDHRTYIGTRVLEAFASTVDIINCHTYSFINDDRSIRRATFPENKLSSFNNIRPLTRWRDANVPSKPVWVTEWGWDSDGAGEACRASECVSERAQAIYAVRGLMILARSNIERATWYFYANTDCETLFCRSGLTASFKNNFQKKTVFAIFERLLELIGNTYFQSVIQENATGYVYALGQNSATTYTSNVTKETSHLLAWLPVDADDASTGHAIVTLPLGTVPSAGHRFTGSSASDPTVTDTCYSQTGQSLNLTLTRDPCLVTLIHDNVAPIVG